MTSHPHWFALLGRELSLAQAELCQVTQSSSFAYSNHYALSGSRQSPDFDRLGGIIRAGRILECEPQLHLMSAIEPVADFIQARRTTAKLRVGLSGTGLHPRELQKFGLALKKAIRLRGDQPIRIILPQRGLQLNAGHISGGKLLAAPNVELHIIDTVQGYVFGVTTWQQDIASYRHRDRDRPARDARVGMLPPKLAQIMLNLATVTPTAHVHDLFCGSGVVLTEALRLGATVSGSDISEAMVRAARTNLEWTSREHVSTNPTPKVWLADARTVSLPNMTTHIVSEGYLGNPHLAHATPDRLTAEATTLWPLYATVLQHLAHHPRPLTILLALPAWYHHELTAPITLPILDAAPDMGYTVEQFAPQEQVSLHYHRPHQTVGRMIVLLKKH